MKAYRSLAREPILRIAGVILAGGALFFGSRLVAVAQGHAGHEPASAYLLALLAFTCGSAGAALIVNGRHLLDRIAVSQPWMRHPNQADRARSPGA